MKTIFGLRMAFVVLSQVGLVAFADTVAESGVEEAWQGREVALEGDVCVHLTSDKPLVDCKVNLTGERAWLYLDAVKPSVVVSDFLGQVTVDGAPADIAKNVRIAEYGAGTVLIPNGIDVCNRALTVFSGENFSGSSRTVAIQDAVTDLGAFDNNIRSLKLRKGFMATLANNPDGTGYSRVFIASDGDLDIPVLPEGFVTKDDSGRSFVSYIRVMKWQWVSKKGWAGSDQGQMERLNVTHYYGWDAGGPTDRIDREYVPHRHHIGWPGFDQIKSRDNVSHVLGHNEPDNTGDAREHPASPLEIIREWRDFMRTGLRVGSPAPTSIWGSWLKDFFNLADSLNYRVDFVVYHQYEHTPDFKSRVNKAVEVSKGRPVWVTEWNNGANWTTGNEGDWPDKSGQQCDAYGAPVPGAANVTLPATLANQEVQLEYMKKALQNIDECDALERTNFYTWVQDARSVELNGVKTLAGQYFADYPSKVAFSKAKEYEHVWKIAPPLPELGFSDDFKSVKISWYDHNGETGVSYTVYRRQDDSKEWLPAAVLELGKDYEAGGTVVFESPIDCAERCRYRVSATAYNGTVSKNSRIMMVYRDNEVTAPDVQCSAPDPTTVKVEWSDVPGARGYRVDRRLVASPSAPEGDTDFDVVLKATDKTSFSDVNVSKGCTYAYRVAVLSNNADTPVSEPVSVKTPDIDNAPEGVFNFFAASSDGKVVLTWDKTYRTTWSVERADRPEGAWNLLEEGVSKTSFEDTSVQNGQTYYYRLLPSRLGLAGEYSEPVEASPREGNYVYVPFNEGKFAKARDCFGGNTLLLNDGAYWTDDRNGNGRAAVALPSGKESYVSLPKGIMKGVSDFTVLLWVKPGKTGGRIFDFGSGTSRFMILNYAGGKFRYKLTDGTKTVDRNDIAGRMEEGAWNHVALSQTGETVKLYLNGEEIASISGALAPSLLGNTSDNFLGKSQWPNDPHPDFSYDDLYIYKKGLAQSEIKDLMAQNGSSDVVTVLDGDGSLLNVEGGRGEIVVSSSCEVDVRVVALSGITVADFRLNEGMRRISGLAKGIYIVNGKKISVY